MTVVERLGRAYELYRRTATSRSAIAAAARRTLIPLVGVLFFGWSLLTILVLYWLENGIVGFWNVPKIIMAQGSIVPTLPDLPDAAARAATTSPEAGRRAPGAVAEDPGRQEAPAGSRGRPCRRPRPGVLGPRAATRLSAHPATGPRDVLRVPLRDVLVRPRRSSCSRCRPSPGLELRRRHRRLGDLPRRHAASRSRCPPSAFGDVVWSSVLLGGIALLPQPRRVVLPELHRPWRIHHASPAGQMAAVYGRVVVLHLTIIFGAMLVAFLGAPIGALLVLVVLKTAFDLGLHLRERRRAGPQVPRPRGDRQAPPSLASRGPAGCTASPARIRGHLDGDRGKRADTAGMPPDSRAPGIRRCPD